MTPIRYTARILPDGHVPVPEGISVHAGDEVEVILTPAVPANGDALARQQWDYFKRTWLGAARGCGADVAAKHDDILYGRE
ncbi:MAG: hypothetical protein HYY16_13490 [Planctomycetes bacterium]|nr:hypothetical protein [Planctomycetota bacterium]